MSNSGQDLFKMTLLSESAHQTEHTSPFEKNSMPFGPNHSFLPFNPLFPNSFEANTIGTQFMPKRLLSNVLQVPLNLQSNKGLSVTGKTSKKRQKPAFSNRKKSKMKPNLTTEEEKSIDADLLNIAGSIDQNIDSDSSTDTVITDDVNDREVFQKPPLASSLKYKKNNCTAIYPNTSGISLLKNALNEGPVAATDTFDLSNNDFAAISTNSVYQPKGKQKNKKALPISFMYHSDLDTSNKIFPQTDNNKTSVKKRKKALVKSSQSIYESMGLDEDLCDVNPKVKGNVESNRSLSASKPSFQNVCPLPIKIEKDIERGTNHNKVCNDLCHESIPNFSTNNMHISMTFEADPYDEEDDLPLSFLKDKLIIEESDTEARPQIDATQNITTNTSPSFIKQEIIEKVLSAADCNSEKSEAVIAKNEALVSSNCRPLKELPACLKTSKSEYSASSACGALPVKIKSEPNLDGYCDSSVKIPLSKTLLPSSNSPTDTHVSSIKQISKNQMINLNKSCFGNDLSYPGIASNHAVFDKKLSQSSLSTVQNVNMSDIPLNMSKSSALNAAENLSNVKLFQLNFTPPCLNSSQIQMEANRNPQNLSNENLAHNNVKIAEKSYKSVAKKKVLRKVVNQSKGKTDSEINNESVKKLDSAIPHVNFTVKSPENLNFATNYDVPSTESKTVCKKKGKNKKLKKNTEINYENIEKSRSFLLQTGLDVESLEIPDSDLAIKCSMPATKRTAAKKKGKNMKTKDANSDNVEKLKPIIPLQRLLSPLATETQGTPVTNFTTECKLPTAEINASSKNKIKKKDEKNSKNLDENLPITLLIKRQKSTDDNTPSSGSFLCTSVCKAIVADSQVDSNKNLQANSNQCLVSDKNIKSSYSSFDGLYSEENLKLTRKEEIGVKIEMPPPDFQGSSSGHSSPAKKRSQPRKKPARKRNNGPQRNKAKQNSNQLENNEPFCNLQPSAEIPKINESSSCVVSGTSETIKEKNDDALVYMSFEEQPSPVEETSEYLNTILSIKKEPVDSLDNATIAQSSQDLVASFVIKKENIPIDSELRAFELPKKVTSNEENHTSNPAREISEMSSELDSSNLTSSEPLNNQNALNDSDQTSSKSSKSSSPAKRKKRTRRNNGWYPKKKSKTKAQNLLVLKESDVSSQLETNQITEKGIIDTSPVSEISTDISTAIKEPVVCVSSLDNEESAVSHLEENENKCTPAVQNSVPLSGKRKNKKKAGNTRKRRKASILDELIDKESPFESTNKYGNNILNNSKNIVNLEINSTESTTIQSSIDKSIAKKTLNAKINESTEIITVEDSPIKSSLDNYASKKQLFPTLNIAAIQKDIEDLECLAAKTQNSDKGIINLLSEVEVIDNQLKGLTVPSSSICSVSKASVSSASCDLSKVLADRNNLFSNKSTITNSGSLEDIVVKPYSNLGAAVVEVKKEKDNENNHYFSSTLSDTHDVLPRKKTALDTTLNSNSHSLPKSILTVKKEVTDYTPNYFQNSSFSFDSVDKCSTISSNPLISQNICKVQNKINFSPSSESCVLKETDYSQAKMSTCPDEQAFITKKVIDSTKSGSSGSASGNAVKNIDDFVKKSLHTPNPKSSALSNSNFVTSPSSSLALLHNESPSDVLNTGSKSVCDDEIQVLEVGVKKVPCVDLTDDSPDLISESRETKSPVNSSNIENMQDTTDSNLPGVTFTDTLPKESISMMKENQQMLVHNKQDSVPCLPEEEKVQLQLNQEYDDFLSHIMDENEPSVSEKKMIDSSVVREKYISEYFKYPFLPAASFHFKIRSKNTTYTRVTSQSLNLSVEKVELRLKNSENIKNQFGNKLGDVIKLDRYPVGNSEVGCYHRILGVAPSHKLLSKCFKSDVKSNTILTSKFNSFSSFQEPDSEIKFGSKEQDFANCSLHDIIRGITECRMMGGDSGLQTTDIYDRDCPSTDTRDSFESHISSISEINFTQKKESMNCGTKEIGLPNFHQDPGSSGRNSALSCTASDFLDSAKNDSADVDFVSPQNLEDQISGNLVTNRTLCSNNIFNQLSLPSKEVLDSMVNNKLTDKSASTVEIPDQSMINCNSDLEKEPLLNECHSLSKTHQQVAPASLSGGNSYELQSAVSSVFNLDVPVLRQILEVAGKVPSSTASNESIVWKSKETFEYNHTQHTTAIETNSKINKENFDMIGEHLAQENSIIEQDDSEDDYVDNEPIQHESYNESQVSDLKEKDELLIPHYKSRWEKIMERKSLEIEVKEKSNEHLLKDCFSVSSKVTNKKLNVSENANKKSIKKEAQILKNDTMNCKSKLKAEDVKKKETKLKHPQKNKDKTNTNSKTSLKKPQDLKQVSKPKHKDKRKNIEENSHLFAPDKPVKKSDKKKTVLSCDKTDDSNQSKRFCGRVTNRGTFLTESGSDLLKTTNIPKHKKAVVSKKPACLRSEEFHSMIKSPEINIETGYDSQYKNAKKKYSYDSYKQNQIYKKNLASNVLPSSSFPLPNEFKFQSKSATGLEAHSTNFHSCPKNIQSEVTLSTIPSSPLLPSDEVMMNRNALLKTPNSFYAYDQMMPNKNASLLDNSSIPFHLRHNHMVSKKIPLLKTPPSSALVTSNFIPSDKMALLKNIISSGQITKSTIATKDMLPFSDNTDFTWTSNQLSSHNHDLDKSSNFSIQQNKLNTSFDSQGLNSSFIVPISSSQISSLTPKKGLSTCLVPKHLKSLVGHKTIETTNVRLLMLEWSVDWLVQQQKFHDPPPISNCLKKVVSSYDNFEDHYNTYFPLMLLDTWHRIYVSWTHLSQHTPHWCNIISYSVKSTFVSVECQTIFNSATHPKGVFPDEGSILMIKYGTKTKDYNIKILGYVTGVKTRRFNPITDIKLCHNFRPPKDGNFEVFQVLTLSYMGAYNSEDIDKQLPVRIHVLCNVKSTLKQNDALLHINKSPLLRSILHPVQAGLLSVGLTPRNSPQDKVNECVRDITKGIIAIHPLPLLTIVKAAPQSDRLNIIPLIIHKMKNTYKTKVLLCVRTVRALGDIAANICLHESLKLVIVNKRGDTSPQFQKYLLDELVSSERHLVDEKSESLCSKNEAIIRTKKQILKDCDIILSLVRNCHDEFMEETFIENETVLQMCCIVDEANLCTEPETLIPILHGISKLILIGDPDYPAKVLSKTARSFDYTRSFFHRAHDLDLITE